MSNATHLDRGSITGTASAGGHWRSWKWSDLLLWAIPVALLAAAGPLAAQTVFLHEGSVDPILQGWGVTPGDTGPGVTREPVVSDPIGGVDAWKIDDTSTASGSRWRYELLPSSAQLNDATARGWILRVTLRVDAVNDPVDASIVLEVSDGTRRYALIFGADAEGDPIVGVLAGAGRYTSEGAGSIYQEYVLRYDPGTSSASVFVAGVERISGYAGISASGVAPRVNWGSGQSGSTGRANYQRVEWGPRPDADFDGVPDEVDNCPFFHNDTNADTGGVVSSPGDPQAVPNGIGDACECGDLSGDGIVDGADLARYRANLATLEPLTTAQLFLCSVSGEIFDCDLLDWVVAAREVGLGLSPLKRLPPFCPAATGFGTLCGDGLCPDPVSGCRDCPQDCGACLLGMTCLRDSDCASSNCVDGLCTAVAVPLIPPVFEPHCGDGVCDPRESCSRVLPFGCYDDCGPCETAELENCILESDCSDGGFCLREGRCGGVKCVEDADCDHCLTDPTCDPFCDTTQVFGERKGFVRAGLCTDFDLTRGCEVPLDLLSLKFLPTQDICDDDDLCYPRKICHPPLKDRCGAPPDFAELCDDGKNCFKNEDCKSQCVHILLPGKADKFAAFCAPGLPAGVPCIFSDDCLSGICQGICLAGNQDNGTPCLSDVVCASGSCVSGFCIPQSCGDGVCQTLIENCLADGSIVLLLPGQPCQTDCGKCPKTHACAADADCATGRCDIVPTTTNFVCRSFCGDGNCDLNEGCGVKSDIFDGDCSLDCGLCSNGKGCEGAGDCLSGHCASGFCAPMPVPCSGTNRPDGCTCSRNSDCANNRCVDPPGSTPLVCAPSGCDLPGAFCTQSSECCDFPGVNISCKTFVCRP